MTRSDIAEQLSDKTGLTHTAAADVVDTVLEIMKDALKRKESINLRGFGTFRISERKGRVARDVTRGRQIMVPMHHVVSFKPGKELKNKVR